MTSRGTASRFLRTVLQNGLGRFVPPLKRVCISFSRGGQSSLGVRAFIEEGVVDYARRNPGTVVYVDPKPCRIPKIVAEYLNGSVREEAVTNRTAAEVSELLTRLSNRSGLDLVRIRKPSHTDSPSIQGQWHPFLTRPPRPLAPAAPPDRRRTASNED